jgi:hypothetical protein
LSFGFCVLGFAFECTRTRADAKLKTQNPKPKT